MARDMKAAGQVDLISDVTGLWATLGGYERDPATGKYPIRLDDDPALDAARYLQTAAVTFGLTQGYSIVTTTSRRGQAARWSGLAADAGVGFHVQTIDPGIEVLTARLADAATGELSSECARAIGRWYG